MAAAAGVAGLLLTGLAGYGIGPFGAADVPTAQMREAADRLDDVLQQSLYRWNNTGSDQRFEPSDGEPAARPVLLDVREHHDARDRTVEADYLFGGAVSKRRFGFDWGLGKGVQGCFRYTFTNMLYTLRHEAIDCPEDLPPPPRPGPEAASGNGPEDAWTLRRRTAQLADRIRPAEPSPGTVLRPGVDELGALLVTAKVDPAVPRTLAVRSGVALLALGTAHRCVFASMDTRSVAVWPAPFEAPCTTDRAYRSYAMAYWPPLPGM
ncbi:hypothetical protein AB0O91_39250 [Kitasatospora sp. NPDC089797]|uniref:hypothetical protein n=1 Tax=Kitasatospora sp. NPDC089797 TaxID=3155298 RepID=UPI00341B2EFA